MKTQLNVRLDEVLKERLDELARTEGKSSSEVVRELIADYVKDRDLPAYVDDLWERVGNKLREKGYEKGDIEAAIQSVRHRSS